MAAVVDPSTTFEQLYQRERQPMVRVAYLITRSRPLADEIVHDAFATLLERWDSVGAPGGYLRTVVVRAAVAARRREWRRPPLTDPVVADAPSDVEDIKVALGTLPARQRAALVLRFYLDLPFEDVGAALGCPAVTARSLVHRGLDTLRKELR